MVKEFPRKHISTTKPSRIKKPKNNVHALNEDDAKDECGFFFHSITDEYAHRHTGQFS